MSINTAHANNGVLIHAGESIILFSDNVNMEFSGQDGALFRGSKTGKMYLTTHRLIFNNKNSSDPLQSFSFPFVCLTDVEIEQPMFGANYIRGKVRAQENGQFLGETKFKLHFKSGGAIDFAQAALKAAYIAKKYGNNAPPPPYTPPTGDWYEAPPPAYSPNPTGYYGWLPNTQAFPNGPPPNSVFMHDSPPPYPGIVNPGPNPTPNGFAGGPPTYPGIGGGGYDGGHAASGLPAYPGYQNPSPYGGQQYPGYAPGGPQYPQPPQQQYKGYPGQPNGYPGGPPPQQPNGYPGGPPPQQPNGYPGGPPPQQPNGYPGGWGNPGYGGGPAPPPSAYPQIPPNSGAAGGGGVGAMGFSNPPYNKADEAAQSAFNPNPYPNPQQPSNAPNAPPPPEYNEPPPSYNSLNNNNIKKSQ